jgi:hypothetical protein
MVVDDTQHAVKAGKLYHKESKSLAGFEITKVKANDCQSQ